MTTPPSNKKWRSYRQIEPPQNLINREYLPTNPFESQQENFRKALNREESYPELLTRLAKEFDPVPVFELAKLRPPIRPHEFILLVGAEWRRLREARPDERG